jgi:hypothetical protein
MEESIDLHLVGLPWAGRYTESVRQHLIEHKACNKFMQILWRLNMEFKVVGVVLLSMSLKKRCVTSFNIKGKL